MKMVQMVDKNAKITYGEEGELSELLISAETQQVEEPYEDDFDFEM